MKRFIALACILIALWCALVIPVYAQESAAEESATQTVTTTEFFNNTVLPLLVSVGSTVVAGIILVAPHLKTSGKLKQLTGIYSKLKEENETLKKLLESTDVAEFKTTLESILTEDLKRAIANIHIDNIALSELRAQYEALNERVQAIINAATNAWSQSPAAVACLTQAPDASALRAVCERVTALENYIREEKGEEAEKLIAEIEGARV